MRENANIRTVFLGVGYHSFSDYYDPSILGDNSAFVSPRYVFVMPVSDKLKYSFMEAGDFSVFYPELFTLTFRYLIDDAPYDYGGFTFIETQTALTDSTIEERLNDQFFSRKSQNGFSSKNLRYFLNIIELCSERNVELVLLNTPLHRKYKNGVPDSFVRKFTEILNRYNLRCIDHSSLQFSDSCFLPDGDHLNLKGANMYTEYLKVNVLQSTSVSHSRSN